MARASCLAALLAVVMAPAVARADAAADVRDIRAGKLPVRTEFRGWNASGGAHLRTLVCSEGGTTSCRASFVEVSKARPARTTMLLDVVEVYCGKGEPCSALDKKTVASFVAAEARAEAALPPLTTTPALAAPSDAFGSVVGAPTRVAVVGIPATDPGLGEVVSVRLTLEGKGGAVETLAVLDRVRSLDKWRLERAHLSPDGKTAVFVPIIDISVMCWGFSGLQAVAVDVPRRRASLANTIGFRAWKKGDMSEALTAFSEATREDPTFPLGWYNRAAVESRTGAVTAARSSFERAVALDGGAATRACKDRDFDGLRGLEPSLFRCAAK